MNFNISTFIVQTHMYIGIYKKKCWNIILEKIYFTRKFDEHESMKNSVVDIFTVIVVPGVFLPRLLQLLSYRLHGEASQQSDCCIGKQF